MSQLPPAAAATPAVQRALAAVRAGLADEARVGAVVVALRGGARTVAAVADRIASGLAAPLHRLALEDLVRSREQRAVALLALLDTAATSGAVVLVDGADDLLLGRPATGAVRRRIGELDGRVVLLGVETDVDRAAALGGAPALVVDVAAPA